MSDKFKVGQPVWAINETDGKWNRGVISAPQCQRSVKSALTGRRFLETGYGVDLVDTKTPDDALGFHYPEKNLRPRDEGQFAPADSTFDWRVTPREIA